MKRVLECLDPNKANGHDGISAKILKTGAEEISLSLSTIYNSYIKKGQCPCDWEKRGLDTSQLKRGQERQGELQTCNCAVMCKQSVRALAEKPINNKVGSS